MNYNEEIREKGIENIEDIITTLKQEGFSQMESVRLLVFNLGLTISKADMIVINSKAWRTEKNVVENFRNNLDKIIDNLNDN